MTIRFSPETRKNKKKKRRRRRTEIYWLYDRGLLLSRPAGVRKGMIGYCLVITFRGQILRSEMGERKCSIEVIVW